MDDSHRPAASPPFRTSPSAIARYFFHDCERFLRFHSASPAARQQDGLPLPQFDHSPLVQAILDSGHVWEQTVLTGHLNGRVAVAPGDGELHSRRFDWEDTLRWIRNAPAGTFLYQPTLRLPLGFYERYGLDPELVLISDNHPDLLAVMADGQGRRLLRVVDLKRGDSLQLTHRVQVLLYALELESILWAQPLDGLRADVQCGEVWLGSQPAPTPFEYASLRPHLERFLRHDLGRVLRAEAPAARWHVQPRCEWCEFFGHCRDQMQRDNDLSRLSHLTSYGKRFLHQQAGVGTLPQLTRFLQRPDADAILARCASLAGQRPRLSQQAAALETRWPQTHGAASPSISKGENIGLFLTLQQEPLARSVYLAGLHLTMREDLRAAVLKSRLAERFSEHGKPRPLVLLARDPDDVPRIRRQWIRVLYEIIARTARYNRRRPWREQLSLQAYVLTEDERGLLVQWLLESLRDSEDPELAEQAITLLFYFQAPELMVADSHPDREVPLPVVVLQDALRHVLALPVEVSYTLPETLQSMGSRFRYSRNDFFHFPLGHGLRAEAIHAAWYRGRVELLGEIEEQARAHLRAARELLQGIRHHAAEGIYAWTPKFAVPQRLEYREPLLSRLAFFARYESLLGCLALRQARCDPQAVQLLLGKAVELSARSDGGFEILSGSATAIDACGFPEWLLVSDDDAGRKAQLEYRDYACRRELWQGTPHANLAVVGVSRLESDKDGAPANLSVEYAKPFEGGPPAAGRRFLLYPRFTDYTTDRILAFLLNYDADQARSGADELFLRLLRDPSEACADRPLPRGVSIPKAVVARLKLTASQTTALAAICTRRAVPVWGPPGTGKTHFLAAAILGLAAAYTRAGRPFRVLVTAFTHAAIENLLRKVIALRDTLGVAADLQIAKAKAWHGDDSGQIPVVEEAKLPRWLENHSSCVLGATIYSTLKACGKISEFDLVVIDEASQVRVPEAAVPISLVGSDGRLVLAGDHLQLPPIIQGVYPEPLPGQPPLHRSIFEAVAAQRGEASDSNGVAPSWNGADRLQLEPRAPRPAHEPLPVRGACPLIQLTENFRMNDVLTSFSAGLLYGPEYRPVDDEVAGRRLKLAPERCLEPFVEACLDPTYPLVAVVVDGVWSGRENPLEAQLVAKLVAGLRGTLRAASGRLYADDAEFFRSGVFLVSPHRTQIRTIESELRRVRTWQCSPSVDTVDKMQGQEADAVIVSYGVSDPEYAVQEAEFIYGLNRLNVALTRARSKCVLFLPRPLLEASPQVLAQVAAARGLAYMRELIAAIASGEQQSFELDDGARADVYRSAGCFQRLDAAARAEFADHAGLRQFVDETPQTARDSVSKSRAEPVKRQAKTTRRSPRNADLPRADQAEQDLSERVATPRSDCQPATPTATPSRRDVKASRGKTRSGKSADDFAVAKALAAQPPNEADKAVPKRNAAAVKAETPPAQADPPISKRCRSKASGGDSSGPARRSSAPDLLAGLNERQSEAARHGGGPLLIIAGAGTGKTTTLVHRVAQLIAQGVPPQRTLLLTFTRRASAEMLARVADVLADRDVSRRIWGGTFHAVGSRLLRMFGRAIGASPRFTVYDRGDAESLLQTACEELQLAKNDKAFPKKATCLSVHSYMVNARLSLKETLAAQFPGLVKYEQPLRELLAAYAARKAELNVMDYDDLLLKWCELLESPTVGDRVRGLFDCVLVDEYQDTNRLQSRLLKGLSPNGRGLTVVGDDAQSIYSFRGATVRNILDFPAQFPGTRVVTLEQNYRSTPPILAASNGVIAEAKERYTKDLWSQRIAGPQPQLVSCDDEHQQVEFVVQRILDHRRQGVPLAQQAVLFRSAHHSILLEAALAQHDLPFVKYGGLKLVEAAHVKDLLAFLRLADNPRDQIAGQRVLTLLPGIGPKKAAQLQQLLAESGGRFASWKQAQPPAKAAGEWPQLVSLLEHLAEAGQDELPMQIRSVMAFYEPLVAGRYDNLRERLNDLEQVEQLASRFADRAEMLADLTIDSPEGADRLPPEDRDQDRLVLSTLHSAKGLEWTAVYVSHASDGKIPHERSFTDPVQLEEERRMLYVALTRAADWLYVCYPRRESQGFRNGYYDYDSQPTRLTRFLTPAIQRHFQSQDAHAFQAPRSSAVATATKTPPPKAARARKAASKRPARAKHRQ